MKDLKTAFIHLTKGTRRFMITWDSAGKVFREIGPHLFFVEAKSPELMKHLEMLENVGWHVELF